MTMHPPEKEVEDWGFKSPDKRKQEYVNKKLTESFLQKDEDNCTYCGHKLSEHGAQTVYFCVGDENKCRCTKPV